jgi:hypothetical protein
VREMREDFAPTFGEKKKKELAAASRQRTV